MVIGGFEEDAPGRSLKMVERNRRKIDKNDLQRAFQELWSRNCITEFFPPGGTEWAHPINGSVVVATTLPPPPHVCVYVRSKLVPLSGNLFREGGRHKHKQLSPLTAGMGTDESPA